MCCFGTVASECRYQTASYFARETTAHSKAAATMPCLVHEPTLTVERAVQKGRKTACTQCGKWAGHTFVPIRAPPLSPALSNPCVLCVCGSSLPSRLTCLYPRGETKGRNQGEKPLGRGSAGCFMGALQPQDQTRVEAKLFLLLCIHPSSPPHTPHSHPPTNPRHPQSAPLLPCSRRRRRPPASRRDRRPPTKKPRRNRCSPPTSPLVPRRRTRRHPSPPTPSNRAPALPRLCPPLPCRPARGAGPGLGPRPGRTGRPTRPRLVCCRPCSRTHGAWSSTCKTTCTTCKYRRRWVGG